jgi:hypothetical protein
MPKAKKEHHMMATFRANKAAVRAAAEAIHARTGKPPTLAELVKRTGLTMETASRHRRILIEEDNYPFGKLKDGGYERDKKHRAAQSARYRHRGAFNPRAADDVLDAIPERDIAARARRIRELNGHGIDPRGALA